MKSTSVFESSLSQAQFSNYQEPQVFGTTVPAFFNLQRGATPSTFNPIGSLAPEALPRPNVSTISDEEALDVLHNHPAMTGMIKDLVKDLFNKQLSGAHAVCDMRATKLEKDTTKMREELTQTQADKAVLRAQVKKLKKKVKTLRKAQRSSGTQNANAVKLSLFDNEEAEPLH